MKIVVLFLQKLFAYLLGFEPCQPSAAAELKVQNFLLRLQAQKALENGQEQARGSAEMRKEYGKAKEAYIAAERKAQSYKRLLQHCLLTQAAEKLETCEKQDQGVDFNHVDFSRREEANPQCESPVQLDSPTMPVVCELQLYPSSLPTPAKYIDTMPQPPCPNRSSWYMPSDMMLPRPARYVEEPYEIYTLLKVKPMHKLRRCCSTDTTMKSI